MEFLFSLFRSICNELRNDERHPSDISRVYNGFIVVQLATHFALRNATPMQLRSAATGKFIIAAGAASNDDRQDVFYCQWRRRRPPRRNWSRE